MVKSDQPGPTLAIVARGGTAHAIVWPGSGSQHRSLHLIRLEPAGATVDLVHDSECVYHLSEGSGAMVDVGSDERHEVITGSMLFVEPGTPYRFEAGHNGAVLVGGPCPPDPTLYPEPGG